MAPKIFIIGESDFRVQVTTLLQSQFNVVGLESAFDIQSLGMTEPNLIILLHTTPSVCLQRATQIRQKYQYIPIILIVSQSSEKMAIAALRAGINDYLKWPVALTELLASVKCKLFADSPRGAFKKRPDSVDSGENHPLIGQSLSMAKLRTYLPKVAATESNVLITGETGTGKELIAQLIHQHSARRTRPFISINCAALPDGLLESELFGYEKGAFTGAYAAYEGKLKCAEGGTVFFDEIGDMSPCAQAKILRVIETKEICRLGGKQANSVDFRVIAATNQDLESRVPEQTFRKDLFFRLNVARIHLPPLRDRQEDIPLLLNCYLHRLGCHFGHQVKGIREDALSCLLHYKWPGNVRELKNLIEALLINLSSDWVSLSDLPEALNKSAATDYPCERERILSVLYETRWNKSKAAEKLNWSRMTLYRKMAKYHLRESKPGTHSVIPSPSL